MGYYSKQIAVYISELILCLAFTIISPFYSSVAISKGVSMWMIGLIFAMDPIIAIPASFIMSRYMKYLGRQFVLCLGIILIAISIILFGTVELFEINAFIAVSLLSRVFAGTGQGFAVLAGTAILTSEYPENLERVIGYYETFGGFGLILGPILGSFLAS